jgi:hypothetical protein
LERDEKIMQKTIYINKTATDKNSDEKNWKTDKHGKDEKSPVPTCSQRKHNDL